MNKKQIYFNIIICILIGLLLIATMFLGFMILDRSRVDVDAKVVYKEEYQKLNNNEIEDSKYTLLCEYNNKYYLINNVKTVEKYNVGDEIECRFYVTDKVFGNEKLYFIDTK